MSHWPWLGDETDRAKREIALQEQPVQPVRPHRDTWYSSPGGQDAVIPSTTPWFAKTF